MKINNTLPCTATFSNHSNSSNLMKVKVTVMHEGENRNGSAFSMLSIEDAKESLKNLPILAFILRTEEGDPVDFDEHNMSIKLVEGKDGYELREFYEEQIIGIIPETNDYHYELIDGVNHVCCTGYIFKSYSNGGADLVYDSDGKGLSMEISVKEGHFEGDVYHIDKFEYHAVTILGDHVQQGMNGTCSIKKFSLNDSRQTIENMNEEIQKLNQGKEDFSMEVENNLEFEEVKKVDEPVVEDDSKLPPEEEEPDMEASSSDDPVEENTEEVEGANQEEEFGCKKKKSYEDKKEEDEEENVEETDVEDEIVEDEEEEKDKKDFSLECFAVFFEEVPSTISEVCDALVERFNDLNSKITELEEFKANVERESLVVKVDEICTEFDFADDEISEVREQALTGEISLDQFKKELFVLLGMKSHANKSKFSQKDKVEKIKIPVGEFKKADNEPYGGLFAKYKK